MTRPYPVTTESMVSLISCPHSSDFTCCFCFVFLHYVFQNQVILWIIIHMQRSSVLNHLLLKMWFVVCLSFPQSHIYRSIILGTRGQCVWEMRKVKWEKISATCPIDWVDPCQRQKRKSILFPPMLVILLAWNQFIDNGGRGSSGNTVAFQVLRQPLPIMYAAAAAAKPLQLCPTLCDSIDSSPPGCPVPGILQARTLEWVAIAFSNAWMWKVKVKSLSHVRLLATPWTAAHQAPASMGFFQARVLEWGAIHA